MPFQQIRGGSISIARMCFVLCALAGCASAQTPLSKLNASTHDPLYTTYAAPLARSEYFVDEAYHLNYYTPTKGVTYETDTAGEISMVWRMGKASAIATKDFYKPPVIHRSYTDIVEVEYWPFATVEVRETFVVYSSRLALLDVAIISHSSMEQEVWAFAYYYNSEPVSNAKIRENRLVTFSHVQLASKVMETPQAKYEPKFLDLFLLSAPANSYRNLSERPAMVPLPGGQAYGGREGPIRGFAFGKQFILAPNSKRHLRVIRGVQPFSEDARVFADQARKLLTLPLAPLLAASEAKYKNIPRLKLPNKDWELAYWSAFNLVRQQMLPPEGDAKHNYYVFSREPTWSWGHEGQVFHESLSMLAYAFMDAASAQNSQRIFIERQSPSGYIAYRVGPYVTKTFPEGGEETSSAPFFAWTNWEIFQISHDRKFLAEAYRSSAAYADYMLRTRDKDGDGFLVWGGNAVLECVRDEFGVIWQLFGHTPESPKKVKSLDLSTMMVMEMRSLAKMAAALGKTSDARKWTERADKLANLIRTRMWDPQDGFFYNLARDTGTFATRDGVSLKRKEIIGFLPMWAGIATKEQAARLVKHLTDPKSFWRRYGVPTLAADDPYYNGNVTKCCQWNGAVWLLWDYMVFRGLLNYGYHKEAEELVRRVMDGVIIQLKDNHRFWESFSPDNTQLASPKNYLWDCIIARMMMDLYGPKRAT
ncbi:MAG TPA: trehalase family glycosidase [Candidatus Acidoferrales bacterium]|nr:trehalase family glycosidase [Candidatus Acidoferrales bacterium]